MNKIETLEGVISKVQILRNNFFFTAVLGLAAIVSAACGSGPTAGPSGPVDPNSTAATVNGKAIKMEEVERAVKQQAQGQETRLSQLELAGARLQVLQGLIEEEVMYQKAQAESTVPTDDEVNTEVNKRKVESRLSAEEFDRRMKEAGFDDTSLRESVRKGLAIQKLTEKITGRVETPKDSEIESFFNANPDIFKRRRGVRLAAIVVDPTNSGQGDTTTSDAEADLRLKEILGRLQQPGSDFAGIAREFSEDPSKLQGGDMGFLSEDELKQSYPQLAAAFMNPEFRVGQITNVVPINGKGYIFKLQERIEKEENLTLESPEVRPQINEILVNSRKQLLAASYQAIAMNEARIENFLAKKVVENPNELSGARPAGAATPAAANTAPAAANTNGNTAPAASNANSAPATNAARPAASNANSNAR
jgi:parvulin-like peptidyl-prolyl isomerase